MRNSRYTELDFNIEFFQLLVRKTKFEFDAQRGMSMAFSQSRSISFEVKERVVACFLFVALFVLFHQFSFALDPQKKISQYGYSVWARQNGLPANGVRVALQTRDGYIWLGTTAGLLRFDGVRFEVVSTDTSDSKNREVITALCETQDSSLWIGTAYDGLRRLKHGKLLPCDPANGFPRKPIKALLESRRGHLWIGSTDGLFEYINGICVSIPIDPPFITSLTEDASGNIYVGSGKGVHVFQEENSKKIRGWLKKDGLPQDDITNIFADHKGTVWIGTQNGFARWSNGKILTTRISSQPGIIHITSILEDRNGMVWVGTTQGIYRLSGGVWTNFNATSGFLSDNILCIIEDQEGSIWFCTSEGLCRFRDVNITTYTVQDGLKNNFITSIIQGHDSTMYFLSAASGGSITTYKHGTFRSFPQPPPIGPSFLAHDGSIWTSLSGCVSRIKNGKIVRYDTTTGLPNRWISAITEDSISLIIYVDRLGIRRFINGRLEPYFLSSGEAYASADFVSCFYKDRTGNLWIGTMNGLVKIQSGMSTTFRKSDGLADDWNRTFSQDRFGHLWFGSLRGGLTHYRDGKFFAYNTKKGLFTNEIYCVLIDDNDNVWISSPKGIGRISTKDIEEYESGTTNIIHSQTFTTVDGMRTEECFGTWQPAGWKTYDGRLWFATVKGAVMIDPRTYQHNKIPPPVYIEQCFADAQELPVDQMNVLQPGNQKFEFNYTALSYLVSERVSFKYMLEGYDRDWVDAGTRRVAYYTHLPSGKYVFRVVACNNDGVWNEKGSSFSFEILPHFYETYWFLSLFVFALGAFVYGIHRWGVWRYMQREKELKRCIQEQTIRLEMANKELDSFSYSVSHDLRAPLRGIDGFSAALLEDYDHSLDDQGKNYLKRVREGVQQINNQIDALLTLSRIIRSPIQRASVDLSSVAESAVNNLIRLRPDRKVTWIVAPGMVVSADSHLLEIVLQQLLENAWKFTSKHAAATIEVGCIQRDSQNVYFVRDNGEGFEMAFAEKLFGVFQRFHNSLEFEGIGIGLAIARRIIEGHGGRIWAESEKGKGATFYFTLPPEGGSS